LETAVSAPPDDKDPLGERVFEPFLLAARPGDAALYLLAQVAFRLRNIRTLNKQRLVCAVLLFALLPVRLRAPRLNTPRYLCVET
jgi:hypothetical protein